MKELQQLLDTYMKEVYLDKERGSMFYFTRYDAEQIALRYAELAVKGERERIVGIIESQSKKVIIESGEEWWNGSSKDFLFQDLPEFNEIINHINKVEE